MFLMMAGFTCFQTLSNMKFGLKTEELPIYLPLMILSSLQQGYFWFIPTIIIGSWLQFFIDKCREKESARINFKFCFSTYGKIERAFKTYFIFFFATSQIYSIVVTFLSFSSFFSKSSLLSQDYYFFGALLLIISRKEKYNEENNKIKHLSKMQFSVQSLLLHWPD